MLHKSMLSSLFCVGIISSANGATFTQASAPPIDNLLSIWGMNVRLEYTDGSYNGTFTINGRPAVQNDIADLQYLGSSTPAFRSVRDALPNNNAGTPFGSVYNQQLSAIAQIV